jgi:hypothetical protein
MRKLTICLLLGALYAVSAKATTIDLGTAGSFAVLGGSTVTNTGNSVLNGDLGLYPGTSITGFPPGIVNGSTHINDGVANGAQTDAGSAYLVLAGLSPNADLSGQDLGGMTLLPGVYKFDSSAGMTGQLTLNFEGLSNQVIVFQIGTTLTTASAASVLITNPGNNDSVFWQVGSSATLGTTTDLYGSILAHDSITLNNGANIDCGRALALNAAVTLDDNTVSTGGCAAPTPEPGTLGLLALCPSAIAFLWRKRR